MNMTSEFTIAVHALVFLNHKKESKSSEELAKNVCTHPARIRKVMARLKKAGLVKTKEGIDGGYSFDLDPGCVTLRDICNALEVKIVSATWRSGSMDLECLIASGMADVMDEIYGGLDHLCRERLSHITIEQIDRKIFSGRKNESVARGKE